MLVAYFFNHKIKMEIGTFDSVDSLEEFLGQIKAIEENGISFESYQGEEPYWYYRFPVSSIGDYLELKHREKVCPITKWSFDSEYVKVCYEEIEYMDGNGKNKITSYVNVDGYMVESTSLEEYVKKREKKYNLIKDAFSEKGIGVSRAFFGSEDGSAVVFDPPHKGRHFIMHMDPFFTTRLELEDEEDARFLIKKILDDI